MRWRIVILAGMLTHTAVLPSFAAATHPSPQAASFQPAACWGKTVGTQAAPQLSNPGASSAIGNGAWLDPVQGQDFALRADYRPGGLYAPKAGRLSVYAFLEGTAAPEADQPPQGRLGFGGTWSLKDRASFSGEIATREDGLNASLAGCYRVEKRMQLYFKSSFGSDPQTGGFWDMSATQMAGARLRVSENTRIFGEEHMRPESGAIPAMQRFGFEHRLDERWTARGAFETGSTLDPCAANLRHREGRLSVGYRRSPVDYRGSLGLRLDTGAAPDCSTWEARNELLWRLRNERRLHTSLKTSVASAGDARRLELVSAAGLGSALKERFQIRLQLLIGEAGAERWSAGLGAGVVYRMENDIEFGIGYSSGGASADPLQPPEDDFAWFLSVAFRL
jgi:hypothetical protein